MIKSKTHHLSAQHSNQNTPTTHSAWHCDRILDDARLSCRYLFSLSRGKNLMQQVLKLRAREFHFQRIE